jgi:sugar lactone lactonase YvrE
MMTTTQAQYPDIEVVLDAHAIIGESPTWASVEGALYWIDVKLPALHRYDPESGTRRSWPVAGDLGAFALLEREHAALLALRHGLHRLDLATGALEELAAAPFDPTLFRFNEGICDATGRFWVGVMFDPTDKSLPARQASLHSFTLSGGFRREPDTAELHNGMAWNENGRRLFLSHSNAGAIYAFDFDPGAGLLGSKQLFVQVPAALGLPDGAAIDVEGKYWCAVHGGGRLQCYTTDGKLDREILLPVSQPTMCAFAGRDLDWLYVTSASNGLDAARLRAEPLAGALLRVRPGVKGIARPYLVR